jgi:transcriptional regulator with XRE-family HTH domain
VNRAPHQTGCAACGCPDSLFGLSIRAARTEAGLSIEEAARLAGMQVSEWMAIEDGHVPQDMDRLRAMAGAMEISFEKVENLILLCREAWEL